MSKLQVTLRVLSADEAENLGHDSTLRTEVGPMVLVVFSVEGTNHIVRTQHAVLRAIENTGVDELAPWFVDDQYYNPSH